MATAEQVAAASFWVDQFAFNAESLKRSAVAALDQFWRDFDGWYDDLLIDELAEQGAELSRSAQQQMAGLAEQYTATQIAVLRDESPHVVRVQLPPVRNGVDLNGVYRRPAEMYRRKVATGTDPAEAEVQALRRRDGLVTSDLLLTERQAQQGQLAAQDVDTYRRIIHPEMSETGTCGLCIAASDRVYKTGDLLPIHAPSCQCTTAPIIGDDDPGRELNEADLKQLYRDAGSTKADALRRTRYQVNEHGELGPVISFAGDSFKGPADVKPLEEDPERARTMLDSALPVLDSLEIRTAAGEDVSDPLGYQLRLVDKLRRIVGD